MKEAWTIATRISQVYGHGDCGEELMIRKEGDYGTGEFPPIFINRNDADDYLNKMENNVNKEVVPVVINK